MPSPPKESIPQQAPPLPQFTKCSYTDNMLTLQSEIMNVMVEWNSPIIQLIDYVQQVQKYKYRAALSSINLKIDEFQGKYESVRQSVQNLDSLLLKQSMAIISELLLSVKLARLEQWRCHSAITNGLRTHLFQKDLDPYGFNVAGLNDDLKIVQKWIREWPTLKGQKAEEVRKTVGQLKKSLKQVERTHMDDLLYQCKVKHPYRAQNKEFNAIQASPMYTNYLSHIQIKSQRHKEMYIKKHFNIFQEVVRFNVYGVDWGVKTAKIAFIAIKRYNDQIGNSINQNNPIFQAALYPSLLAGGLRPVDANDLAYSPSMRVQSRPALVNRSSHVEFLPNVRVFDQQTNTDGMADRERFMDARDRYADSKESSHPSNIPFHEIYPKQCNPFDTFAERRKNYSKEFIQNREYNKKLKERQEEYLNNINNITKQGASYLGSLRNSSSALRNLCIRGSQLKVPGISYIPWLQISEYPNIQSYFVEIRAIKQKNMWEVKTKEKDRTTYFNEKSVGSNMASNMMQSRQRQTQKQLQYQEEQRKEAGRMYQIKRREEDKLRKNKLKKLTESRPYSLFMSTHGLADIAIPPGYNPKNQILRYGLRLYRVFEMNDALTVDRFFNFYFRDRYYRQNEEVKSKADNPIEYLDQNKHAMASKAVINNILKKCQKMKFFIIWGSSNILSFRLQQSFDKRKICHFTMLCLGQTSSGHKALYELRRRVKQPMEQIIIFKECHNPNPNPYDKIYSKVQNVHRIIYDRHRETIKWQESVGKGSQIAAQILQQVIQQIQRDF